MNNLKFSVIVIIFLALPYNCIAATGDQFTYIFGYQLNETKLKEIQKGLGHVDLVETGDAAEYNASLCYFISKQNITIEFWSSELGGGEILDGLMVREDRVPLKSCRALRDRTIQPSDLGGLKLGMTLQEFEKLMTNSKKITGPPKVEYHFAYNKTKPERELERERKYSFDPAPYWSVLIQVIGTFNNNRLIEIRIFKSVD